MTKLLILIGLILLIILVALYYYFRIYRKNQAIVVCQKRVNEIKFHAGIKPGFNEQYYQKIYEECLQEKGFRG